MNDEAEKPELLNEQAPSEMSEPLSIAWDEAWPVPDLAPEFAGAIARAFSEERSEKRGRRLARLNSWVRVAGMAACFVLVGHLGLRWWQSAERVQSTGFSGQLNLKPNVQAGEVEAEVRQTVQIGSRVVAVVEGGAHLKWESSETGEVRVFLHEGQTFFRVVPRKESFVVLTGAGQVEVTGTAFVVDVNQNADSNSADSMRVGVLEGQVQVSADEAGSPIVIEAGQWAKVQGGEVKSFEAGESSEQNSMWAKLDGGPWNQDLQEAKPGRERDILKTWLARYKLQIKRSERELEALKKLPTASGGGQLLKGSAKQRSDEGLNANELAIRCAGGGDLPGCPSFLEPTPEILGRRAKCGIIVYEVPWPLMGHSLADKPLQETELTIVERKKIRAAEHAFLDETSKRYEAIYLASGGKPLESGQLSFAEKMVIFASQLQNPGDEGAHYIRWLAKKTATSRSIAFDMLNSESVDEGPPWKTELHLRLSAGERYHRHLSAAIGEELAQEIRRQYNGYGGTTSLASGGCDE